MRHAELVGLLQSLAAGLNIDGSQIIFVLLQINGGYDDHLMEQANQNNGIH